MTNLLDAIAREEGWLVAGSRAKRNSNPGNLEYGKFARAHGSLRGDPKFAVFANPTDGFHALEVLLLTSYGQFTLRDAIYRYAPPSENDSDQYLKNICDWTGLSPESKVSAALELSA